MKTTIYPRLGNDLVYPTLALCGETGEIAEKIKKIMRDKEGNASDEDKTEIKKELGDVLWYITALSKELGFTLNDVAESNIIKVEGRRARNTTHGQGDNR